MSISKAECLKVYVEFLANADTKYNEAMVLSKIGSFGSATSLLIISMEETMKALVLYLDGNGFEFRKRVKGIKSLFENHQLRYFLAIALSVLNIVTKDFIEFTIKVKKDPGKIWEINLKDESFQQKLIDYFKITINSILVEIKWFSNSDTYRQDGFYVDYIGELKTPLSVKDEYFMQIKLRVDNLRKISTDFLELFTNQNDDIKQHFNKMKKQMIEENHYSHISKLIEITKDRKNNPFELLIKTFSDLESEFNITR